MTSLRDEVERLFRRNGDSRPSDFWALQDVSFEIPAGAAIGIIGRNGAGKSTLLKILSRITDPTNGEICLRGRVGSLLEVGTGFHPELSGRDNIYLNGSILGMTRAEIQSKFAAIVDFSEVAQFLDTPVKRYSSGMYVKLAFAIAAHLEPEILIVDEVLAVGDAAFQRKCLDKMQEISSSHGRTILFVSHAMTTIRRLCKQCILLEKGRSLGMMPTEQAIERYSINGASSEMSLDVSQRRRDWGTDGEAARILQVTVAGDGHLRFNAPLEIEILVRATRPLSGMMLGFAFNTFDGQRVLTLDSDGDGRTFNLREGRTLLRLRLDRLPVHPGRYYAGAALGRGKHFEDIIDSFALWEIETSIDDFESDRGFGGCRITPKLEVTPVAGDSAAAAESGVYAEKLTAP